MEIPKSWTGKGSAENLAPPVDGSETRDLGEVGPRSPEVGVPLIFKEKKNSGPEPAMVAVLTKPLEVGGTINYEETDGSGQREKIGYITDITFDGKEWLVTLNKFGSVTTFQITVESDEDRKSREFVRASS